MTAAEPQEDEMTERPSDIERAARVAAEYGGLGELIARAIRALPPSPLAEENARLIAALAECFRLSGAEPGSDDEWTLAARAVDAVRRLREDYDEVDPVAEAERRLEKLLAGDMLEALAREDIACLLDGLDRCPGCFACDARSHAQKYEALRRAREVDRG